MSQVIAQKSTKQFALSSYINFSLIKNESLSIYLPLKQGNETSQIKYRPATSLKKETLAQMLSCEFCQISKS